MKNKKHEHWLDEAVKEDEEYFKKQVESGVKKLAGEKTKERERNCFHCKVWNKTERFIKEVLEIK